MHVNPYSEVPFPTHLVHVFFYAILFALAKNLDSFYQFVSFCLTNLAYGNCLIYIGFSDFVLKTTI